MRRLRAPLGFALLLAGVALVASALLAGSLQPSFVGDSAAVAAAEGRFRQGPNVLRRVITTVPAAPSRYAGREADDEDDESIYFDDSDDEDEDGDAEDDYPDDEEDDSLVPVLYQWPKMSSRLKRQGMVPGHLVQRRWMKRGKEQGYVSVPFTLATRNIMSDPAVNVCLVSRRERSDVVVKEWQEALDDLPTFDISGEVDAATDLDPLEPSWETPLDEELPTDAEMREQMREEGVMERMQKRFNRPLEELEQRGSAERKGEDAKLLRAIVASLPEELRTEEFTALIRSTSVEVLKLIWGVHTASGAGQIRWRLACTDADGDSMEATGYEAGQFGQPGEVLRAYFVLAGEGLDFVPEKYADRAKVEATARLSGDAMRRMSSEDWATSVTKQGTNVTEALKRVPFGWTTFLKGESWPKMEERGAVYHLPQTGRRVFIQVDYVQTEESLAAAGADILAEASASGSDDEEDEASGLNFLGPLAGLAAGLVAVAKTSGPYQYGKAQQEKAKASLNELATGGPKSRAADYFGEEAIKNFEEKMRNSEFGDASEAPVVLMLGSQSETGKVISRKLVSNGYHVVMLNEFPHGSGPQERREKMLPQGAMLAAANVEKQVERVSSRNLPDDMYNAVAGIDKLVVCQCDEDPNQSLSAGTIKDVLSCWQIYRQEFAERQRQYTSKVRIFNFARETDFELWDLERQRPSDMCYGLQKGGWTRNSHGTALFIGQFFEPVGQAQLRSPRLKLNFKRFSGVLIRVYNQAVNNKYSFFLRTSDFEETRLQYEFEFECKASSWHVIRMPFNAFKPVRADGVELPEDEADNFPLRREDVVQMGVAVRTGDNPVLYTGDRLNYFSLAMDWVKVFRTQVEPQVVYLGRAEDIEDGTFETEADDDDEEEDDFGEVMFDADSDINAEMAKMRASKAKAEAAAAAEIEELESTALALGEGLDDSEIMKFEETKKKSPMQAVMESGLSFSVIKVNGMNDHKGGAHPVSVQQASVKAAPLTVSHGDVGRISREDAAELVVSALTEPACVNTEIAAGEPLKEEVQTGNLLAPVFEISSTAEENVKEYLKQLTPNR